MRQSTESINRRPESVWDVGLKIENCCLKKFVKIRVGKKSVKMREILFKN